MCVPFASYSVVTEEMGPDDAEDGDSGTGWETERTEGEAVAGSTGAVFVI